MPSLVIRKSILIRADADRVFAEVRDFRRWPRWSPWLVCEPETRLTYAEDGTSYRWEGKVTGTGEIRRIAETSPRSMECRLKFEKPFPSESAVGFAFADRGDGTTEVTWTMDGALPWFLFPMVKPMAAFLGADYERGLAMLKDLAESGAVPSRLEFRGRGSFPGCGYVGVRSRCAVAEIGPAMESAFGKLEAALAKRNLKPSGPPLAIYHRWDVVKGTAEVTAAFPVAEESSEDGSGDGLVQGRIPATTTDQVRHTGPYRYLTNAWAAAMGRIRAGVNRRNGRLDPFEVYENDPGSGEEPVTTVHVPVRGDA